MPLLSSFFLIRKVTKALIFISKKQISRYFKLSLIIIISQLSRENLYGQKFLTDTLYVNFKSDTLANTYPLCIKTIRDQRDEDPDFVMYQTKNKFLLFPVDQEIHLTKSLVEAIHESILPSDSCTLSYTMHINRFEIEKRKGRFASSTFFCWCSSSLFFRLNCPA